METLALLHARLAECLSRDRQRFSRRLHSVRQRAARQQPVDAALSELQAQMEQSVATCQARLARLPTPQYDLLLPVCQKRAELLAAIAQHQVLVVCGETGSGKTTQLPKLCLELGLGARGLIGHTQPRRIAARSVAARIAEELGQPLGQSVGYKVRFNEHTSPDTLVKLMTDGILLAETQTDRDLSQYEVLIIDEAHERSLNIDFLLGYLHQLLPRRPDLKVIITSATIDPQRFAQHFHGAPIIEVSGRTYPVEVRYRPLLAEDEDGRDRDLQQAVLDAVDELWTQGPGDVLVFMAGEREIRETAEALRKHHPPGVEILPLYARLSAAEQLRVFQPHGRPRIVLATNVAETSLTVPGIRYVIDPGYARISRYSHRAKIQRLPIEPISQASANQRAGRCGRVMAGVCVRLYSEQDYQSRPAFTDAEILRTNLAAVILQMAALKLGAVEAFPFIDPPDRRLISDGFKLLYELGAVTEQQRITPLGHKLARLPIDPRLGRMILAAEDEHCVRDVLIIASFLAVQDPRERPLEFQQQAEQKHRRFADLRSDFLAVLKLWDWFHRQVQHLSKSKLREACRRDFLSFVRLREWQELQQQLSSIAAELKLPFNERELSPELEAQDEAAKAWPSGYAALHKALLTGLLGQVGLKQEDGFLGARGRRFYIFPGSGLQRKPPKWLMSAEIVETSRVFARMNARIEPEWLEPLAGPLLKRSYSEPHWEQRGARVVALEQVTLYGLPIVSGRKINYGPLDPQLSHQLFVRYALVEGQYHSSAEFLRHNRALLAEVDELETRARRRDLHVDPEQLLHFYLQRIPDTIHNGAAFEHWRKQIERTQPQYLQFNAEELLARAQTIDAAEFPDYLLVGGLQLPLSYRFEPNHPQDGATLRVPLAALNLLRPAQLEWGVPGLLGEKASALLKALPKPLRKHLVPVPDTVAKLLPLLQPLDEQEGLCAALSRLIKQHYQLEIASEVWSNDAIAPHLRIHLQVLDVQGQVLAQGRDLQALQVQHRQQARSAFAQLSGAHSAPVTPAPRKAKAAAPAAVPAPSVVEREIQRWDFGALPEVQSFERNGVALRGYPALTYVADGRLLIRLHDHPDQALHAHRRGLWRLIELEQRERVKYLRRQLPGLQAMALHFLKAGTQEQLRDDLVQAAVDRAYLDQAQLPRNAQQFAALLERGGPRLLEMANRVCAEVAPALASFHVVQKRLNGKIPLSWMEAVQDIRLQLSELIYPGFVAATPDPWLGHLARYLKALELRVVKLEREPERDRARRAEIERLARQYRVRLAEHRKREWYDPALAQFHWSLEELRVSQFAQELKTAFPVSARRLDEQWQQVRKP